MGSNLCIYCNSGLPTRGDFCGECEMPQNKFVTMNGERRLYKVHHDGEKWISKYVVLSQPKSQQYYSRR